jgi:hypothetical protein
MGIDSGKQSENNPYLTYALLSLLHAYYQTLQPAGYENVGRITNIMLQMLVIKSKLIQNFVLSTEQTIYKRLKQFYEFS